MQHDLKSKPLTGLLVALVIVVLWISSLEFLSLMTQYTEPCFRAIAD
ncbi:MAG: hypothetical protein HC769_12665 [Cyanobacteria bacterium CRU_2_1]|nr:hypothetical protein [Cyanobacteria bacterium RU_5_0]NJR59616.1 hypothetical protein [Cyanobacteria bacterium CRU_2_1]